MSGEIKLGLPGQEVTLPAVGRKVQFEQIELSKPGTTASGLDVEDIIGYKMQFNITFDKLLGPDLDLILPLYDLHQDLNLIITNRDGSNDPYTVKLQPITRTRERCEPGLWIWSGVTMKMRERSAHA